MSANLDNVQKITNYVLLAICESIGKIICALRKYCESFWRVAKVVAD